MNDIEFGSSLYRLYHSVVKLEDAAVGDNKNCTGLTVNELNLIDCVHRLSKGSEGPSISAIANELEITRPSTTVAVNKLVSKEIVTKSECEKDGRSVRVKLTPKGEKAYSTHHTFQNNLTKEARKQFSEEEYKNIVNAVCALSKFFDEKIENLDN